MVVKKQTIFETDGLFLITMYCNDYQLLVIYLKLIVTITRHQW